MLAFGSCSLAGKAASSRFKCPHVLASFNMKIANYTTATAPASTTPSTPQILHPPYLEVTVPHHYYHYVDSTSKRKHLYQLGNEWVKLTIYERLSTLLPSTTGSLLKCLVHDVVSYFNRELAVDLEKAEQFENLLFFGSNRTWEQHGIRQSSRHLSAPRKPHTRKFSDGVHEVYVPSHKWLLTSVGLMIASANIGNVKVQEFTDMMIKPFVTIPQSRHNDLNPPMATTSEKIESVMNQYYTSIGVNESLLYQNRPSLHLPSQNTTLDLPPLPRIQNKVLLTKALIHKEVISAVLNPNHPIASQLDLLDKNATGTTIKALKHELSFFDGLGDFFLMHELNNLLYRIKHSSDPDSPGPVLSSINTSRSVLVGNSFFSKLALAYNLHRGIEDEQVQSLLFGDYLKVLFTINRGRTVSNGDFEFYDSYDDRVKYEQEILGDYFEQYVGALFLEDRAVASEWVREVYERVLSSFPPASTGHPSPRTMWRYDIAGR